MSYPASSSARRLILLVAVLAPLSLLGGCGAKDAPLPSATEARTALQTALDAWKSGQPAPSLASNKPPIEVVDSDWKSGKALDSYTIGEESGGTGNKTFAVTLNLKGAKAPDSVKYMVFGTGPVHVYRDVDFERMSNMENNPGSTKPRR